MKMKKKFHFHYYTECWLRTNYRDVNKFEYWVTFYIEQ
jgi:hypothetical protein